MENATLMREKYFKNYPGKPGINGSAMNGYLINSNFLEYFFFLILGIRYNVGIYGTQFDRKDFKPSNYLSFEFENSGDALISNQENINILRSFTPAQLKENIPFFATPLRKFRNGIKRDFVEFEKPIINTCKNQNIKEKNALEGIAFYKPYHSRLKKTITNYTQVNDVDFKKKCYDLLNNYNHGGYDDLIIKTFINQNISEKMYEFMILDQGFVNFLVWGYDEYVEIRNSKKNISCSFIEYLQNKFGKDITINYISRIKNIFKSIEYIQQTFNTKGEVEKKKFKGIQVFYINRKNLGKMDKNEINFVFNTVSNTVSLTNTNLFASFSKKLIKQFSMDSLNFS